MRSLNLQARNEHKKIQKLTVYRGHSPDVKFPRVLGIEACGIVEDGGGDFEKGSVVVTWYGTVSANPPESVTSDSNIL
jgi:hypothetical protein